MANIRLTCPTCVLELEVDAAHQGQEVECGNCGRVFVAHGRPAPPSGEGDANPRPQPPGVPRSAPAGRNERPDEPPNKPAERRPEPRSNPQSPRRTDGPARRPVPRARRPPSRANRAPRARGDDEFDYEPFDDWPDEDPPRREGAGNNRAVAALVLGLLSVSLIVLGLPFACCCPIVPLPLTMPLSLAAVVTGALGVRGDEDSRPMAVVGLVLGLLCLGFAALQLTFGIIPQMNAGR